MQSKRKLLPLILAAAVLFSMTVCAFTTAVADSEPDAPSHAIGDVDGSGKCDMQDVVETQRYIAKLKELNETQLKAADVDEPYGEVNMIDVVCMQKYIAKLIDMFPAESVTSDTDSIEDVTTESDTESINTDTVKDSDVSESDSDSENTDVNEDILTIADVVKGGEDKQVTAVGQVCYLYGNSSVVVEGIDEDGKVWGVLIYDKEGVINGKYPLNSIIEFSGNTKLYNGYLEVEPTNVKVISEDNTPIPPVEAKTSELADYVSIVVVIKNCTLGAYDSNNVTMTDSAGEVNCYKPVSYPEGLSEGSLVDLVCVPYLYSGTPQIRVSYQENYIPVGNNTSDTDPSSETETETETNTEPTTDTSGNTDNADNGVVLGEPITNLDDILNKDVVIAIQNYALSAHSLLNGYGGSFEIKNIADGLVTNQNTVYNIIKSGDNYYLKSRETGKFFCCKGKTESSFSGDLSENCAVLLKKDSGGFTINELATGDNRIFALLVNAESSKSTFRWYKGSTANPSNVVIYPVKTKYDDTDDNIEDSDCVSLVKKLSSLNDIVGKKVVLVNKGYALTSAITTESPSNVITVGKVSNGKTSTRNVFTITKDSDNTYYLYNEYAQKYLCHNTAKESKLLSNQGDEAKLIIKYDNSTQCFKIVCNYDNYELALYTDKTDYTFRWYKYDVNTDMSRSFEIYTVD